VCCPHTAQATTYARRKTWKALDRLSLAELRYFTLTKHTLRSTEVPSPRELTIVTLAVALRAVEAFGAQAAAWKQSGQREGRKVGVPA
jgi:hypothetical protein